MGALYFVTGGARSGKSTFAQRMAEASGRPVTFIATMEPLDEELEARVARHRETRPASWTTIEAPRDLVAALRSTPTGSCVLIDCISLWVTNWLMGLGDPPALADLDQLESELDAHVRSLLAVQAAREGELIIVTNEVGGGVVPPTPLGRAYRDLLGRVNQQLSLEASRAWLLVAGRALELPSPAEWTGASPNE